ncbi:DUF1254 domain-containing protein [Rhodococcoides fascians]|uniref:DUF1254 domain-containing protein n=2 Tax=Nocardiaceae TaxID=85025 RepID=UPI000522EB83|nr:MULTISPECIES: DUF1254 domain-containing protein [Rhodococcus]
MCAACAPNNSEQNSVESTEWALNVLVHERRTAGAGFQPFRVPNVDTLYSNGWLDLSDRPVTIDLPEFGDRYYTLNFLDAYSNASNVSRRTYPRQPQRILLTCTESEQVADEGTIVFRVATPIIWLLMRIQVFGQTDLHAVHAMQDAVTVTAPDRPARSWPVVDQRAVETSWSSFSTALDAVLDLNGVPIQDAAHVHQFQQICIGPGTPDAVELDDTMSWGTELGFEAAMAMLSNSRSSLGQRTDSGWTRVLDKGAHGHNFLARAVMNFVGLGANVVEENCSYNTYVDGHGRELAAPPGVDYLIEFDEHPPAQAFWSITLYVAETGWLYDAPGGVHSIGSATNRNGTATEPYCVTISGTAPSDVGPDKVWLPAPPQPFFLVLRIYQPTEDALMERWTPPPVERRTDGVR